MERNWAGRISGWWVGLTLLAGCSPSAPQEATPEAGASTAVAATPSGTETPPTANPLPAPGVDARPESSGETPAPDAARRARDALARLTKSGISVGEWEAAHQELVDLGPAAADALREALGSADPVSREWSASILALNVEAATAARAELEACLAEESGFLRANAAAALLLVSGAESGAIPVLLELTRSTDADLKRMAALNLANVGDLLVPHLEEITPLLADADPEVVRPIVELLGRLGPAAAVALPELERLTPLRNGSAPITVTSGWSAA